MFSRRDSVVVERNVKAVEIAKVRFSHICDQRLFASSLLTGTNHDCRTVRVVRTDIDAAVPSQFLKSDPDIGLDVLDQMPQMDVTVGIWQCGCYENASISHSKPMRGKLFSGLDTRF